MAMLNLLELAAGRLTATGLEQWLANPALQELQGLSSEDCTLMTRVLQHTGFRWGLDAKERGGDETHGLRWCLDRWLLGLVLPVRDGLAPAGAAPFQWELDPERLVRWWTLLDRLARNARAVQATPDLCCMGGVAAVGVAGVVWGWPRLEW
jgi:exodeoxyribonuclease V gamma subunit